MKRYFVVTCRKGSPVHELTVLKERDFLTKTEFSPDKLHIHLLNMFYDENEDEFSAIIVEQGGEIVESFTQEGKAIRHWEDHSQYWSADDENSAHLALIKSLR